MTIAYHEDKPTEGQIQYLISCGIPEEKVRSLKKSEVAHEITCRQMRAWRAKNVNRVHKSSSK